MRRSLAMLLAVGSLTLTYASALHAQRRGLVELAPRAVRGGFYLTGGLGDGLEQYKYSDDPVGYTDWLGSPSAVLRLGGTPNQSVRLGAELFGWWNDTYDYDLVTDATETFTTFMIDAQFYPSVRNGFYLKGGIGLARSGERFPASSGYDNFSENGFGWTLGAGYDIALSRHFAIAPIADFYQGRFTRRGEATITEHVLNLGVSITFQTGASRYR